MLLVETYIDHSPVEGIGLFAAEDIPKGTIIWRFNSVVDQIIEPAEVLKLPEATRHFLEKYASLSPQIGKIVLCGDNDRFTNHSYTPNRHCIIEEQTGEVIEIAACDIKKGEELTNDYREIDANFDSYADELR